MAASQTKTVVIIGHSSSGVHTCQKLVQEMKKQQIEDVRTMVIDSRDFFEVDGFSTYSLTVGGEAAYEMHSCTQEELKVPGITEYKHDTVASVTALDGGGFSVATAGGDTVQAAVVVCATGFSIPLLKPSVGAVWAERKTEVAEVRRALRRAKSVVIAGSGNAGIDMAGDVRQFVDVAGGCRVHLIVSGELVLNDSFGEGDRKMLTEKIRQSPGMVLHHDRVVDEDYNSPSLTPRTIALKSGAKIEADVYLPVFATFHAGNYLSEIEGASAHNGMVNVDPKSLQCTAAAGLFAVGCGTVVTDEGAIDFMRIEGQAKTVAANVLNFLSGHPMVEHTSGVSFTKHDLYSVFGHGHYAQLHTDNCGWQGICARFFCGFPFPCLCGCWLCGCNEGPCGYTCCRPGGKGLGKIFGVASKKPDQTPVMKWRAQNAANKKKT